MKPSRSIVAAALAVATTMGALVATPGAAQTRVVVGYRDYDGRYDRYDRRHDDRRWRGERRYRDYDRDGIPNRYDRHPYRYDPPMPGIAGRSGATIAGGAATRCATAAERAGPGPHERMMERR